MPVPPPAVCPPLVLCFAHSDPTTAGGLQADLLTLASLGTHALTVATAISVQDTAGISGVQVLDAELIEEQARALLEDMQIAAFKVGLLASVEQVSTVAEILSDYDAVPLVLHPSLTRMLHDEALEDELLDAIRDLLLPQTSLLVIDIDDVPRLLGDGDDDAASDPGADDGVAGSDERSASTVAALLAERILESGCQAVLLVGVGGPGGERSNLLFADGGLRFTQPWESLPGSFHGAADTLAAGLAGCLACGEDLFEATRNAHDYTARALAAGYRPGMGRLLPDRLFWSRGADDVPESA